MTSLGIGAKRKRLLFERFGSLSGIKQASAQDLVNVLGRKVGQTVVGRATPAERSLFCVFLVV